MNSWQDLTLPGFARREKLSTLRDVDGDDADPVPHGSRDAASARLAQNQSFALTDVQRAYWLGRSGNFELGNVGCHIYVEIVIADPGLREVERAWQRLILRHRMLRAIIRDDGVQEFLEDTPLYRMAHLDLTEASAETADAMRRAVRAEMSHRVFSPDVWPLFDMRTSATSSNSLLHFSIDLLVADFWSLQVLLGELALLILHPQTELEPLTMDFRDYRLALAARRNPVREERAERYWLDRLDTLPAGPRLPLARQPGTIAAPVFERRNAVLEPALWSALRERAKASGLTPSGLLMAAFSRVLAAWSETEHFTLNVTLFNRALLDEQVYRIVGDFTSLLLLEVREDRETGFLDGARRLASQFRADLRHRGYDGVRLLQELAKRRGPDRPAAMPVVFTSALSNGMPGLESTEEAGSVAYSVSQTPQVWLDHQVYERGGRLFLSWDVVEALFPAGLIDDMFGAYEGLLRRLAVDESAWTSPNFDLLPEAQRQRLREVNRANGPIPDGLLHHPFLAQVRARPDHLAIIGWKRRLTYAELAYQARSLAARLRNLGAEPGRLVAVAMEKGWEQVVAVLAILETGAAFLPIDPDWPEERRLHLLAEGDVGIVVTQPCLLDGLALPATIVGIGLSWQPLGEVRAAEPIPAARDGSDLAYVIFTSGSTGEPKGVMIEHRSALNTILDINARYGICPADRVLALSALSFDLSIYDIFGTLAAGATLVLPHPSSAHEPDDWDRLIQREHVTVWNSVPALQQVWLDHIEDRGRPAIRSLRLILLSGDWIPVGLPDRARAVCPAARIVSLGGATEAAIWSVVHEVGRVDPDWTSIPYGTPLRNQRLRVLDSRGRPCAPWVRGEIGISGTGLARGYLKDPVRTEAKFVASDILGERVYRTGDMGRCWPDGTIEFLGRTDQQVKLNGYRIELGEIEAVLGRHPQVAQVAVTLERTASGGRLAAFVVAPGVSVDVLAAYARTWLPSYMVPTAWHALPELPLTRNGKVDRRALPTLVTARAAVGPSVAVLAAQQASDVSAEVLSIVSQALAMPELHPADNLLAAGATSLDLVRVAGQIERRFGFRPSFPAFFADPTVAALSRAVGEQVRGSGASGGTGPTPSLASAHDLIVDPGAREAFRREQRGIRAFPADWGAITLPHGSGLTTGKQQARRTTRTFASDAVPLALFGSWLAALSRSVADGYAFGSAGASYSVQTYIHVKADGVAGCPAGTFYHHPLTHALIPLTLGVALDPGLHEPFTNRPAFERARFSVFFVSRPAAIVPLYGEMAERLAQLEAGAMAQVIESSAGPFGLGLCAVGWLDFPAIRHLFLLDDDQQLLHAHLGGLREAIADAGEFEEGVI